MRSWDLHPQTRNDLCANGMLKNYGTGTTLLTSAMPRDEILLIPAVEIGKMTVREGIKTEAIEQKTSFIRRIPSSKPCLRRGRYRQPFFESYQSFAGIRQDGIWRTR